MIVRYEYGQNYYMNSNGVERYSSDSGYGVQIGDEYTFYPIQEHYQKNIKIDLMEEINQLKILCEEYKRLSEPYADKIDFLIEATLQDKNKILFCNDKYLSDYYRLYSLNITVSSKLSGLRYERGFGSRNDINLLRELHLPVEDLIQSAVLSKDIKTLRTGYYDVVFDQEATGLLVHEFIGHIFEADNELIKINDIQSKKLVCAENISIIDNPCVQSAYGSYAFDDEGTTAKETYLIKNGRLNSLLHSNQTCQKAGVPSTSNARAINYQHKPLVRMSNTYMKPSDQNTVHQLIQSVENGIYIKGTGDSSSGKTPIMNFREMFIIEDGKIGKMIANMRITGNMFSLLRKIDGVANDFALYGGGNGGCYKQQQGPMDVSSGGPHILLRGVLLLPIVRIL
ncbi:MAG: TldD/PmbA family protein [Mobilitalea sp.]